jgi:poly(3-hydroxybutyrate) depolymerase
MGFRTLLATAIFCFALGTPTFALEQGEGSYTFPDPETEKAFTVWYYKPANFTAETPVAIVLHGMNRNASTYRSAWTPHAEKYGLMLLVPEFSEKDFPGTNGYNMGNYFGARTEQEREGLAASGIINPESVWSFRVIDKVFADFLANREKTGQTQYSLYGHSAGAQFAHRMLQFLPEARVRFAIAANAGWYTMPDLSLEWPYGLKGTKVDEKQILRFLSMPLVILLGEKDNDPNHHQLRRTPEADVQGNNRFARGHYFFAYGQQLAKKLNVPFGWRLQTVPGVAHSNKDMSDAAAALIAGEAKKQ